MWLFTKLNGEPSDKYEMNDLPVIIIHANVTVEIMIPNSIGIQRSCLLKSTLSNKIPYIPALNANSTV